MQQPEFINRHIPLNSKKLEKALKEIGVASISELINKTVPPQIQRKSPLNIPAFHSEYEFLQHISNLANDNIVGQSHIGMGYYNTITPPTILRNVLENPGWYTQYTPYQAEISQGRLEALLNFQTLIAELTQLPIANASLLDEGTAAAEAMVMLYRLRKPAHQHKTTLVIFSDIFPQTHQVLQTRAHHLGITLQIVTDVNDISDDCFAILFQTPDRFGRITKSNTLTSFAKTQQIPVICCCDLLYLTIFDPPTDIDVCVGSTQRFGVPLGFGGPHAAFFATTTANSRKIPGRIIGKSIDKYGNPALRMALQTREQHIRKEKATSNICTAQALLAIMAGMYAVYHGPKGLEAIAQRIHHLAYQCKDALQSLGFKLETDSFFDTIYVHLDEGIDIETLQKHCDNQGIYLNTVIKNRIGISFDETHSTKDLTRVIQCFAALRSKTVTPPPAPSHLQYRSKAWLTQPIFNTYHSETELARYMKQLENKDLSLVHGMIPLGSCTMKLNAAVEMMPLSNPLYSNLHPYAPAENTKGYHTLIEHLGNWLCDITDFQAVSFQPNSGAQGEYAGILAIKQYLTAIGQSHRNMALIPVSAHGTNPASAVIAGLTTVPIRCDDNGDINMQDLTEKCETYQDSLAVLMITYPSTHGVFEENIKEICALIHQHGGQVYMDGANLNAQIGLTSPGIIGADVCHINLHKTFAIPHGGGGPGMGPICVKKHLEPYLPGFSLTTPAIQHSVASSAFSSASILLISYAYVALMGGKGLTYASEIAILKANYIKARLEHYYPILYTGSKNTVAHELIIDCRPFKKYANIDVEDIAKRLIDYSFHAPTLSWPVAGTLMIEPTESEPFTECDRICDALIAIYNEIQEITNGTLDKVDNPLKNAPHTQIEVCADTWDHSYSRSKAAYPLPYLKDTKFWPSISRINQAHGDRNLICTCN